MTRSLLAATSAALFGIALMGMVAIAGEAPSSFKAGDRFWVVVDERSPDHPKAIASSNQPALNELSFDRGVIALDRIRQMRSNPNQQVAPAIAPTHFTVPVTIIALNEGKIDFEAAGTLSNNDVYAIHLQGTVDAAKLQGANAMVNTMDVENKKARLVTLDDQAAEAQAAPFKIEGSDHAAPAKKSWKERMFGWMKRS